MREAPQGMRRSIRLRDLLALVAVISILGSIWIARIARARRVEQRKVECASHLRALGGCIRKWGSQWCSSVFCYPPTGVPPYSRAAGRQFLDALRTYPTQQTSMCGQNDDLFVCEVLGTSPGPKTLDYRVPSPATIPGGEVQDGLWQASWPIACDRPTNHSPGGDDDINVLLFSGAVIRARPGSPEWNTAMSYTQDP